MDNKELMELVQHVKKRYPQYVYLNQNTSISNVHLYKLLSGVEEILKENNKVYFCKDCKQEKKKRKKKIKKKTKKKIKQQKRKK